MIFLSISTIFHNYFSIFFCISRIIHDQSNFTILVQRILRKILASNEKNLVIDFDGLCVYKRRFCLMKGNVLSLHSMRKTEALRTLFIRKTHIYSNSRSWKRLQQHKKLFIQKRNRKHAYMFFGMFEIVFNFFSSINWGYVERSVSWSKWKPVIVGIKQGVHKRNDGNFWSSH